MSDLRTSLALIVADHTAWPAASIADETHFFDEMGFDSLDLVEAVFEIEKKHGGIDLGDDMGEIATFGDLVRCVERQIALHAERRS